MMGKKLSHYTVGLFSLLIIINTTPVFGEVTNLQVNSNSFYQGDQITFSGNVEKDSVGLVTIVIRDHNNDFVQLIQAIINHDESFEKIIKINDNFSEHGMYNATGFILNMTKGVTTSFGVSLNGVPINLEISEDKNENQINEIIDNIEEIEEIPINMYADFVDPNKDPQYYIDRYYNEVAYKSWFDRNYPGLTIEEAVNPNGNDINSVVHELIDQEIIPEAEASSIVQDIKTKDGNSEIAEISLAIASIAILFGAVIGIKKKVDTNTNQISINKDVIRKKLIQPIIGNNPKEILQIRLAKGEINLEDYEKLKSKLD
ncbi:MAG: SHOCT domain-containing protein [Candidatus Nitrosopumilus sp. bin_68KS]